MFVLHQYEVDLAAVKQTYRKIQETLVKIGDKPKEFVGSSQWIGAIELSYILDELLGVSIIHSVIVFWNTLSSPSCLLSNTASQS